LNAKPKNLVLDILQRIREILEQEEDAHVRLADAFTLALEGSTAEDESRANSEFICSMQSFDTTSQRISHLTRVVELITGLDFDGEEQLESSLVELQRSPVVDDADWLEEAISRNRKQETLG